MFFSNFTDVELSLTSGIAQLLTEISMKLINEQGRLAGEGSELRGPTSAYFGCFSPSAPEIFVHFSYSVGRETTFAFKLPARPTILEFIDVIVV